MIKSILGDVLFPANLLADDDDDGCACGCGCPTKEVYKGGYDAGYKQAPKVSEEN